MAWEHEKWVSIVGKLAWIIAIIAAIVEFLWGLWGIITAFQAYQYLVDLYASLPIPEVYSGPIPITALDIWNIITSIVLIIFAIIIIRPRFSKKCAEKDWNYLLNDVLSLGSIRFPWIFGWAIIAGILGMGWAAAFIAIPAIMLIFFGPEPYQWKK